MVVEKLTQQVPFARKKRKSGHETAQKVEMLETKLPLLLLLRRKIPLWLFNKSPTVSSELHKTTRFSFQPTAHAEHVQATAHY